MRTLWYEGPSGGESVPNSTVEQMVERLRRGWEYWGTFGPVGDLEWYEHPPQETPTKVGLGGETARQHLIFIRHSERGWYFEFSSRTPPPKRWLVPFDSAADRDDYFPQWASGDSQMFLAGCFVPQATAEQVVRDFMSNGEPSPAVQWFPFGELGPRMDHDDLERQRRGR